MTAIYSLFRVTEETKDGQVYHAFNPDLIARISGRGHDWVVHLVNGKSVAFHGQEKDVEAAIADWAHRRGYYK